MGPPWVCTPDRRGLRFGGEFGGDLRDGLRGAIPRDPEDSTGQVPGEGQGSRPDRGGPELRALERRRGLGGRPQAAGGHRQARPRIRGTHSPGGCFRGEVPGAAPSSPADPATVATRLRLSAPPDQRPDGREPARPTTCRSPRSQPGVRWPRCSAAGWRLPVTRISQPGIRPSHWALRRCVSLQGPTPLTPPTLTPAGGCRGRSRREPQDRRHGVGSPRCGPP